MDYLARKEFYKKIEDIRKRPLITYVTSIRPGCTAQMAQDMIPEFIKHINKIDEKNTKNGIDILILSVGGDPIVSWRIISLLREKFKKIGVLIPYTAYSAATLLALGADEILMHPYGNLGPIDPQINLINQNGSTTMVAYEDIIKYIEFIKDIGITDQELLQRSFDKLTNEIRPTGIGFAKRSSQLGLSMGEKLLGSHMSDKGKAKVISETMNTKFYHHGYPLGRNEAREIGLKVIEIDQKVENLMWQICESFMEEFKFNNFFDPSRILADQLSKIKNPNIGIPNVINDKVKIASIESVNLNSYVENNIVITYQVQPDMSINNNTMISPGSWESFDK